MQIIVLQGTGVLLVWQCLNWNTACSFNELTGVLGLVLDCFSLRHQMLNLIQNLLFTSILLHLTQLQTLVKHSTWSFMVLTQGLFVTVKWVHQVVSVYDNGWEVFYLYHCVKKLRSCLKLDIMQELCKGAIQEKGWMHVVLWKWIGNELTESHQLAAETAMTEDQNDTQRTWREFLQLLYLLKLKICA